MHLVHIEDKFINFKTGEFDWDAAVKDKYGLAILAIFFYKGDLSSVVKTRCILMCPFVIILNKKYGNLKWNYVKLYILNFF